MIVSTIGKLFFALIIGFYLNKKNVLDVVTNRKLSYIIMQIALPCMIISSVANTQGGDRTEVLKYLLTGFIFYLILPFIAMILVRCLRVPLDKRGIYQVMFIFSNTVFMGYPVAAALFGIECIFYIAIFHMVFNLLYFSYGIYLITKGTDKNNKLSLREIFNNGIIASLTSLILYLLDIPLPDTLTVILTFLGSIVTPVSMMVIGATIGSYALKEIFDDKRIFILTCIRLLIYPTITYFVMTLLGFDGVMRGVATITLGMPVASVISMSSNEYGCNEKHASIGVVVSTVCSIVTIPIMLIILQ